MEGPPCKECKKPTEMTIAQRVRRYHCTYSLCKLVGIKYTTKVRRKSGGGRR
jgi:hypothetical protein